MKRVLLINGHPDPQSFNAVLARAYAQGALTATDHFSEFRIADLDFNPSLQYGYRKRTTLEPDLEKAIEQIKESDHLVWVFPMWWYGYPALMKGFVDRTFLPGITYQPVEGKPMPKKLLKGKTARIIITADAPRWYDRLVMHSPAIRQFKKGTLAFCGVKTVGTSYISPIKGSSESFRKKWLDTVEELGKGLR